MSVSTFCTKPSARHAEDHPGWLWSCPSSSLPRTPDLPVSTRPQSWPSSPACYVCQPPCTPQQRARDWQLPTGRKIVRSLLHNWTIWASSEEKSCLSLPGRLVQCSVKFFIYLVTKVPDESNIYTFFKLHTGDGFSMLVTYLFFFSSQQEFK